MALIRRVSRLFTADIHAVLDHIEEPLVVLRQAIRDMEEELARQNQREKWLENEIESATTRIENMENRERELDAKLDVCFDNNNEGLARKLIRRKLETNLHTDHCEAKRKALRKQLDEFESLLAANRDQLEGMRQKAALLSLEESPVAATDEQGFSAGIDEDEVEIAFLRERQARTSS